MKNLILILTIVVSTAGCRNNETNPHIKIEPSFSVTETKLVASNKDFYPNTIEDSWRQTFNDTIVYTFSFRSEGGISLLIKIINKEVIPQIEIWSDYKEFEGSYDAIIPLEEYFMTINSTNQNIGDTLMGEISIVTEPIKYFKNKPVYKLSGTIYHINQ